MIDENLYRQSHPGCVRIYDISIDAFRNVTQGYVDLLVLAYMNGAKVRELANALHKAYRDKALEYHRAAELE